MKDKVVRCPKCNSEMEIEGIAYGVQESEYYCPKCGHTGGPDRGARMLPIVTYERKKWFFDERLRQLRNVRNPHDFIDLNDFEIGYFKGKTGKTT